VASPSSAQRFIENFGKYTAAVHEQAVDRDEGRVRSIAEYLEVRRGTIGIRPSFDFILLTEDLPDEVVEHPHIQKLALAAIDLNILVNVRSFVRSS
jgi:hypothetical protein